MELVCLARPSMWITRTCWKEGSQEGRERDGEMEGGEREEKEGGGVGGTEEWI